MSESDIQCSKNLWDAENYSLKHGKIITVQWIKFK